MSKEVKTGMALKIALAVVSILFIISLIANMYFYSRQYGITPDSGLESQVADLQSQLDSLTTTHDDYVSTHTRSNSEYDDYVTTHSYSNEEYNDMVTISTTQGVEIADLENQINALKAPKLVTRLGAIDHNPIFGSDYLHITGEVWNVGTNAAFNCKLHVKLYHGNVVSVDSYIDLYTISGESWKDVDEQVFYSGDPLDNWAIDVEWD